MKIFKKIFFYFTKSQYIKCGCNQLIPKKVYNKDTNNHIIGNIRNVEGKFLNLYCDGKEA